MTVLMLNYTPVEIICTPYVLGGSDRDGSAT